MIHCEKPSRGWAEQARCGGVLTSCFANSRAWRLGDCGSYGYISLRLLYKPPQPASSAYCLIHSDLDHAMFGLPQSQAPIIHSHMRGAIPEQHAKSTGHPDGRSSWLVSTHAAFSRRQHGPIVVKGWLSSASSRHNSRTWVAVKSTHSQP